MKTSGTNTPAVQKERAQFLELLLANPNHFGTLRGSAQKVVKALAEDTTYEELKCIGFNSDLNRLEGVVWVKRPEGYDGGLCTAGSHEYVSFFLSYDNGVTWLPQGTTSFQVYDVEGPHPLEYGVSVPIEPPHKLCYINNLPLVRAILSWNVPPAGPTAIPVWGNMLETHIQIPGYRRFIPLDGLLTAANAKLPEPIAALISDSATVELQAPAALTAAELASQYAKSAVPAHRFLHGTIKQALANPSSVAATHAYIKALGIDPVAVVGALSEVNGNTDYEQLTCIGLEEGPGHGDALVGTLVVKLPTGYLGNPCAAGSKEYVAFWIDWGHGWQWEGTVSVTVHDIAAIPKGGLSYAVYRPVNLNEHRKPCEAGPVIARMRAILSWDTPPPAANPNYVPIWGNRLETLVLLDPGQPVKTGDFTPYLTSICDIPPCSIDQGTGFAPGEQPFGAFISIYGFIPGAPAFNPSLTGQPKYQVTVQQVGTLLPPQVLTDPFTVTVYEQNGGGPVTSTTLTQSAVGGVYTYQDMNPDAAGWRLISPHGLLCVWNSAGKTGLWRISVTAWDSTLTTQYPAGSVLCPLDGTSRQSVVVALDQLAPDAQLLITGYQAGGVGPILPASPCQTFTVGDIIQGTYSVTDAHLGGFSLQAEPTAVPTSGFTIDGAPVNGLSYPNPLLPLSGTKSGVWTYNTANLEPCGYTIQLFTNDRTIVDCVTNWQNNSQFQGFCLVAPGQPVALPKA